LANRAYLMNHAVGAPTIAGEAEEACLLGANYQIPILWMAMFDSDDFTVVDVPFTNDDGEESVEKIPTLFAATGKAMKTYARRRSWLVDVLGVENVNTIAEWDAFLSTGVHEPTLQLDLIELWIMYDNAGDLELDVRDWLAGVSNQSKGGWDSLCSQANLDDPEVRQYGIRGFPWGATLPWA
jgi:hypothetical protein